jgi:hypothetical protein
MRQLFRWVREWWNWRRRRRQLRELERLRDQLERLKRLKRLELEQQQLELQQQLERDYGRRR